MFVNASVNEVYHTLFEAGMLVLIVIVVFLQNWRATLVPATTVPVTIIGAFAAMAAMGFTINLLTLFAIVLAIGIVVDDAIVVVEGATQHMERGKTPKQASIDAMNELMGPIVGVTLVLMSVFIPPAFMPGITGQMYRQFALVIAATAFISAINAATLKPTQCALWLRQPDHNRRKNFFFRGFNSVYERLEKLYVRLVCWMVGRSGQMAVIGLLLVALAGWGLTRIPTGFIPTEDQGYAMVTVQLPDGASLERTEQVMDRLAEICKENPAVERTIAIGGMSPLDDNASLANAGIIYLMFKDWSKRGKGEDLLSIYNDVSARLAKFQDAKTMVLVPPPIQGLGLSGGFQMQVELANGTYDFARLQAVADEIVSQAKASPMIRMALTPLRASAPQISINVNRTRAQTLGVDVGDVNNTVQTYLGSSFVNLFTRFGHNYIVYAQADAPYRLDSDNLKNYYVRGQSGQMVPLSAVASIEPTQGPSVITLYNLFPSATINGSANDGIQLRPGVANFGRHRGQSSSRRDELRVDRHVVSGKARWQFHLLHFRAGDPARLLRPGRAIRKLDYTRRGDSRRAAGLARHGGRVARSRRGEQSLCADRPRAPHRALGQERDPDCRNGSRGTRSWQEHRRRYGRGRAGPISPDPDDLFHIHPRRASPSPGERRGRKRAKISRPDGRHRHAYLNLPCGPLRAGVLRRVAALGRAKAFQRNRFLR